MKDESKKDHQRKICDPSWDRELLLFELEQARDDQRASLDHLSQSLVAGVAGLAIVFTIASIAASSGDASLVDVLAHDGSVLVEYPSETSVEEVRLSLSGGEITSERSDKEAFSAALNSILYGTPFFVLVQLGIVFGVLFYFVSLGMERAFRYHYMRDLELALEKTRDDSWPDDVMGWNEASSPLVTLNVSHMETSGSKLHFVNLALGVVLIIGVCVAFACLFLGTTDGLMASILAAATAVLSLVVVGGFLYGTTNSRRIYEEAKKVALQRRYDGGTSPLADPPEACSLSKAIGYYVYPRPGDVLKVLFVVFGAALACFSANIAWDSPLAWDMFFLRLIVVVLVVDVLAYQARYQINDVRGVREDPQNP